MALIPIMGQPVNLVPNNERAFGCEPENSFCTLYEKAAGNSIKVQVIQTPCDPTLVSNGSFIFGDTDWNVDVNVVVAGQKATHVVGSIGQINQDIYSAYSLGNYFSVTFTVTDMSGGTIELHVGETAATEIITENGIYTFYVFPPFDDTLLLFEFSADCDGAISNISSYKLLDESEVTAYLIDSTGAIAYTMTTVIALTSGNMQDRIVFTIPTQTLDEGCYTVQVIDTCTAGSIGSFVERITGGNFSNPANWTVYADPTGSAAVTGGKFVYDTINDGSLSYAYAVQPFAIPTGVKLLVKVVLQTGQIDAPLNGTVFVGELGVFSINTFLSSAPIQSNQTYTRYFIVEATDLSPSYLEQGFYFDYFLGTGTTGTNEILDLSIQTAEITSDGIDGVFESNCIQISADVSGTQYVKGYADEVNNHPTPNKSLGFLFQRDVFFLEARLALQFSNPHSPIKTENYLYSSGRKKKAYAQVGKAWDLTFHAVDENMHDTIANIINCDQFTINGNEYITDEKEYTANYGPKGVDPVGESTIEVQKIENTRFNTNI
jgi:hypothetical protein